MDNEYGRGQIVAGKQVFWINADCPVHGNSTTELKTQMQLDNQCNNILT